MHAQLFAAPQPSPPRTHRRLISSSTANARISIYRRILHQIRAALPTDEAWNAFNNAYDHTAYQTISIEFGVDPQPRHSDWRTTRGTQWLPNGPGSYIDRFGVHPQSYLKQSIDANSGFVDFMLDQTQGFALTFGQY